MSRYTGEADFSHGRVPALGVLLTNLGTPAAPTTAAVRRYLGEFLSDPRVVERPRWLWRLILHGIVLRVRPARSARLYRKIWTPGGPPLLRITERQAEGLEARLRARLPGPVRVVPAMRYGRPSIREGLEALRAANARRIVVLPLYPQHSAATSGSTFDAVTEVLRGWRWIPELRLIGHYHDAPEYLEALAGSIREHWETAGRPDRLLFSFHGIPRRYFLAGDPYHCHCQKTARQVAERLALDPGDWALAFQSRFGPEEWLRPYTDATLESWGRAGVRRVDVVCPGFAADCLETLEEIAGQNRELFLSAGGERFDYIPALNVRDEHIEALTALVLRHVQGWPEAEASWEEARVRREAEASRERALSMGAPR